MKLLALVTTFSLFALGQAPAPAPANILGPGPWNYTTYERNTKIQVSIVARNLAHPWSLAFLPEGGMLVTERPGKIRIVRDGKVSADSIVDLKPLSVDQLFDIALHPKFAQNRLVYFTYMKKASRPDGTTGYWATTAVARGKLVGDKLEDVKDVFLADAWQPLSGGDASRITFAPDGTMYVSSSHRRNAEAPQALDSDVGKVLRLNDDGTVPKDNPFVGQAKVKPEIFSYGHRTVLGLTFHPVTGALWETENGPQGGDEVNIIKPGKNYGWPLVTYGRDYDGKKASPTPWAPQFEAPELFWVPSITASGIQFYSGDKFPAWKDNLFVGAMTVGRLPNTGNLQRIVFNADGEQRRETLLADLKQRIRDVRQGPDGLIYLLTDENDGAILKIEPGK